MEINFCPKCDNLLFIYSDEEDKEKLYLGCKACGHKNEYTDQKCIYSNEYQIDLSETINKNQYLEHDITLPTIKNNPNIKCPNVDCESNTKGKPSAIIYIKYDHESMDYLYGCKYCKQKWNNK